MTKISAQVSAGISAKPDQAITEKKTPANSETDQNLSTVVSNDKKFSMQMQADMTRLQLQNRFAQKNSSVQQQDENRDINGVSTKTILRKAIEKNETQESVLRRTYDEMAFKAGISNQKGEGQEKSPLEMFVEDRMAANKESNNGEYKIFHDGTNEVFTADEWAKKIEKGSIDMNPTDADIAALKTYRAASDYNDGVRIANNLLQGMKNGDYRALDDVKNHSTNSSFQEGFLNKLGADNFVKLENDLKDDLSYGKVLRDSLSTASQNEAVYSQEAESETTFSKEVVKRASVEQLGRLTENKFYPMGTNFLVEAGKRVTTENVGWRIDTNADGPAAVYNETINKGSSQVLQAIANSPEASSKLLQDGDFVKKSLRMSNIADPQTPAAFAQIIRNATSPEAKAGNPETVKTALMNISQGLADRGAIDSQSTYDQTKRTWSLGNNAVNETVAKSLADAYINNSEIFSNATNSPNNMSKAFDGEDVRTFIGAIQPYYSIKDEKGVTLEDKMASATALRYNSLLKKAEETGDVTYVTEAANLAGTFVNGNGRANLENAKERDARQEKFAKAVAIVAEVTTFNTLKGVGEIAADVAGKVAAATSEGSMKGNNADNAAEQNRTALNNQQATNMISVVQVFENGAYEKTNGVRNATPEQKKEAEQFLADLKTYNDSLPADEKILDANGRLINPNQMTDRQQTRVHALFGVGTGTDYGIRLSNRMNSTWERLANATERQIH